MKEKRNSCRHEGHPKEQRKVDEGLGDVEAGAGILQKKMDSAMSLVKRGFKELDAVDKALKKHCTRSSEAGRAAAALASSSGNGI